MYTMTPNTTRTLRDLEHWVADHGLEHHLAAARRLARDGLPASDIRVLMRGLFRPGEIAALVAEAAEVNPVGKPQS